MKGLLNISKLKQRKIEDLTIALNNPKEVSEFYHILMKSWMYIQDKSEFTVGVGKIDTERFPEGRMNDTLLSYIEEHNGIDSQRLRWPVPQDSREE